MKSTQIKPSIVFCHGLWADGSCFSKVIAPLQAEGHQVIAAQYALNTTADDVATVKSVLGRVSSPAILVGHSYGGSVITARELTTALRGWSTSPRLLRTPTRHRRHSSLTSRRPTSSPTSKSQTDVSGCFRKVSIVSQAICPSRKRSLFGRQCVPNPDLFNAKVGGTAWRSKPSWYIVAKNDRTVHPDMERFVAKRMGATTTEVASSHVAMLSNPKLVVDVICAAAKAVQEAIAA